jgi:hypothetical protein
LAIVTWTSNRPGRRGSYWMVKVPVFMFASVELDDGLT